MRMRRKKNLDARIENCSDVLIKMLDGQGLDWKTIFGNDNEIQLEIGCGKGQFILELAQQNPSINYVAVERQDNVIVAAMEKVKEKGLTNVKFLLENAFNIETFFKESELTRIYLNFSCPFPKTRYAKHRLTHHKFLQKYHNILKVGCEIYFKTDNRKFFEFSLNEFSKECYLMKNITFDLHASSFEGNIVTEYEKRFSDMGNPIYRLEATNLPNSVIEEYKKYSTQETSKNN